MRLRRLLTGALEEQEEVQKGQSVTKGGEGGEKEVGGGGEKEEEKEAQRRRGDEKRRCTEMKVKVRRRRVCFYSMCVCRLVIV